MWGWRRGRSRESGSQRPPSKPAPDTLPASPPLTVQTLLEKTLAVRNAMLELAVQLDTQRPGAAAAAAAPQAASASGWGSAGQDGGPGWVPALFQGEAPVATACLQLATALGQLASLEQVEEMVAQLPPSSSGDSSAASPFAMPATSGQHQDGSGDSGRAGPKGLLAAANLPAAGGSGGVGLDLQLSGAVTLGAPADDLAASAEALLEPPGSGGSGSVLAGMIAAAERIDLEGNKLQQLPVPPPDNPSICQKVQVGRWVVGEWVEAWPRIELFFVLSCDTLPHACHPTLPCLMDAQDTPPAAAVYTCVCLSQRAPSPPPPPPHHPTTTITPGHGHS